MVGDHWLGRDNPVCMWADKRVGGVVFVVGAILPHRSVDLALREIELFEALGWYDTGIDNLFRERLTRAAGVPIDGDRRGSVGVVGDGDCKLLDRSIVPATEKEIDSFIVEVNGPEMTADV